MIRNALDKGRWEDHIGRTMKYQGTGSAHLKTDIFVQGPKDISRVEGHEIVRFFDHVEDSADLPYIPGG